MGKATTKRPAKKPDKPRPDFPLFPHATGRWAKKIRQQLHYFGPWSDPDGALTRYLDTKDDLHAGRTPRPKGDAGGLTLSDLCNRVLTRKEDRVKSGELDGRTFGEYVGAAERLTAAMGRNRLVSDLRPSDFGSYRAELVKRFAPSSLVREITMARMFFIYGFKNDLLALPIKFGDEFSKPSKKKLRKDRHAKVGRTLEADEVRKLIELAGPQVRAMILLAINCAYGNYDVATLPLSAIDLKKQIAEYARPKTGVERRTALWPETVDAIKAVLASRPKPTDPTAENLVFVTKYGKPWIRQGQTQEPQDDGRSRVKMSRMDAVAGEFTKLLKEIGIKRAGVGFYSLRATFRTVTDSVPDRAAVDRVMGHEPNSMATYYVEWKRTPAEDLRIKVVTDFVHAWLFPTKEKKSKARRGKA